ncbi:MAG: class I SAM-dependent methyltransferase [Candidatus Edwardsbacteria bacterium]|nr:class I SAM-dependent methyltransferase [Candidatus Edwardsbacteria bacterium]
MNELAGYPGTGPIGPNKYWEYPWALLNGKLAGRLSILDAACGKSPVQCFLSTLGHQVHGIDNEINVAWHGIDASINRGLRHPVRYCVGDIGALPYRPASFDRVFCLSVLEHCRGDAGRRETATAQQRRILTDLYRVLRPGGRLVLTFDHYCGERMHPDNIDVGPVLAAVGIVADHAAVFRAADEPAASGLMVSTYLNETQVSVGVVVDKPRSGAR